MELTVHRVWFSPDSTQGSLDIDGVYECYTMEPRKDQSAGKPYCISAGTYVVKLMWSNHFQRVTPHILDVPDFEAIEIHPGNYPRDTEGCLMVGETHNENPDVLGNSDDAFGSLMTKLRTADEISITYLEEI